MRSRLSAALEPIIGRANRGSESTLKFDQRLHCHETRRGAGSRFRKVSRETHIVISKPCCCSREHCRSRHSGTRIPDLPTKLNVPLWRNSQTPDHVLAADVGRHIVQSIKHRPWVVARALDEGDRPVQPAPGDTAQRLPCADMGANRASEWFSHSSHSGQRFRQLIAALT